jgi:hypothetical protein
MAENPIIRYDIPNRIALGAFLVDEERVTGFTKPGSPTTLRAVPIYRFSGERIHEITILTWTRDWVTFRYTKRARTSVLRHCER